MPNGDDPNLDFYFEIRPDLVASALGQWVLIQDRQLVGVYPTYEEALVDAMAQFDPGTFLIRQVLDPEPVETI